MGQVISIIDYRRAAETRAEAAKDHDPVYVCTSCDSEHFVLHTSGTIRCGGCQAVMGNIAVTEG